jgi:hypothetical protein
MQKETIKLTELTKNELYQKEIQKLDKAAGHVINLFMESGLSAEEINYIGTVISTQYLMQVIKKTTDNTDSEEYADRFAQNASDLHDALTLRAKEMGFSNIEFDYFIANSNYMNAMLTIKAIMTDKRVFENLNSVKTYLSDMLMHNPLMRLLYNLKESMLQES